MTHRRHLPIVAALAVVLAGPATPARADEGPKGPVARLLPAVSKALSVATATSRPCATVRRDARGLDTATFRAPISGYLTARLRGKGGDWDLRLRDAASGRSLGASQGFGASETVQAWVHAGQRVVADGCRRRGAGRSARVVFRLADVKPPKAPAGTPSLVRVFADHGAIERLEGLGFDVTHNRRHGWADVIVSGDAQLQQLRRTGLRFVTRQSDLRRTIGRTIQADRAYRAKVDGASPLPSGRTTYRTYEEIQTELKGLVDANPGLVRKVVFGKSFQGREISGIEIARDVDGDDGRPVYFVMALHHAREWPSAEAAMEFAQMLVKEQGDARIAKILRSERVVILPVVNPDGYISSRNAFDPGDSLAGQDPNVTLVEIVAPPGGIFAYRRKNCNGEIFGPELPCELAWGVDPNRNYGNLWGGPGSSSDLTSQSYHGQGPRSESEVQSVWNYARTHHVTTLMTIHNVAALVLRPPGLSGSGLSPDERRMKEIGDAMGQAAGYTSQFGWQLYDTAGTTEDDTYAATGGYGYTIEMGPPDGGFHEPYEVGVVAEWTGKNDHAKERGGLREAMLIAAEAAAIPADHAILRGSAPAGKVLRLRKGFDTKTSEYCRRGIEPIVTLPLPGICLTGTEEPQTLHDEQDTQTKVPGGGTFEWHIGQSTRPFVNGGAVLEETEAVEPAIARINGSPGTAPMESTDHEVQVPAVGPHDKVRFFLSSTLPEDYDIEVFRKEGDGSLTPVGSSGNVPGADENVEISDVQAGTYVVRVTFYAAVTGAYELVVSRLATKRTVTTGTKEAYQLTCEEPDGTVLERHSLVIDRGQSLGVRLGCGTGRSTFENGTPLANTPDAPLPSGTPSIDGVVAPAATAAAAPKSARVKLTARRVVRPSRRGVVRVSVTCPANVTGACKGTLRLRGAGRTLGTKAFSVRAGRTAKVAVRLTRTARRTLARRGRIAATATIVRGKAGTTTLSGSRKLTLRRR